MKKMKLLSAIAALGFSTLTATAQSWLTNGLVAHYPFNGNANDASGNGNNGIINGATLTTDRFNRANSAYYFDGNSWITMPQTRLLDGASNATISAWVVIKSGTSGEILAAGDGRYLLDPVHLLFAPQNAGSMRFQNTTLDNVPNAFIGGNLSGQTLANFTADTWHQLVVVLSTNNPLGTLTIYVDGIVNAVQIGSDDGTAFTKIAYDIDMPFLIGGITYYAGPGEFWTGKIDDIRIYNRALSSNEVSQLYEYESANTNKPIITSFSPTFGPVGTAVTITGTNFSPTASNNIVFFGGVRAIVYSSSANLIVVTVPAGAVLAPITVTANNRVAASATFFNPTFSGSFNASFAPPISFSVGANPRGVVVADFNGDGIPDLATANTFGGNISVLLGTGSGTFGTRTDYPIGLQPGSIAFADFTGDGHFDLAVSANYGTNSKLSVLLGTGQGTFGAATDYNSTVHDYASGIAVGDLNGDGLTDLAVANDLGNAFSVLIGTGGGSFGSPTDYPVGPRPLSLAVADFNRDGKLDIVAANCHSNTISLLLNNGGGSFTSRVDVVVGDAPIALAVGDFNGDGIPDIATINGTNSVSVLLGVGDGSFVKGVDIPLEHEPISLAVGDFNGDGRQGLVIGYFQYNSVSVLLGRGDGTFGAKTDFSLGNVNSTYGLAVGDFNMDGKPDIVAANPDQNIVSVLLNTTVPPVISYTLSATTAGGGLVVPNPQQTNYPPDTLVNVTATPLVGWKFLYWLGDAVGINPVVNLTMTRNKTVQAVFATQLTTASLISTDPQSDFYPFGSRVKLTVTPPAGTYFSSWGGDAAGTNNPLNFFVDNPNPSVSCLLASLNAGHYALTVVETGQGHVATSPLAIYYNSGQGVSITPVPDGGESFIGWGGDASGTANPLVVTMNQSKTITANFTTRPTLRVGTPLEGLFEDGFRFSVLGVFGGQYQIIGSTNLLNWTPLGMLTNTYGLTQFLDPNGTNAPLGFYRLMQTGQ